MTYATEIGHFWHDFCDFKGKLTRTPGERINTADNTMTTDLVNNQNAIIEMIKKAPEMLKELYKNSTPDERKMILKVLGGGGGLAVFLWFILKL